jgi:YD repeat-containing protein
MSRRIQIALTFCFIILICFMLSFNARRLLPLITEDTNPSSYPAAWQPGGNIVAIGDRHVSLFNEKLERIDEFGNDDNYVQSVVWSPDGTKLLEVGSVVRCWSISTGRLLFTLKPEKYAVSAVWSPDGSKIATGGTNNAVQIWDVRTVSLLNTLQGPTDQVNSVTWSPDGNKIAGGGSDGFVHLWDATATHTLNVLSFPGEFVTDVGWSPDGAELAVASTFKEGVRIWNVRTEQQTIIKTVFQASVMAWHPSGRQLALGGPKTVQIWDLATDKAVVTFPDAEGITSLSWNSDGNRLASTDRAGNVRIWDVMLAKLLFTVSLK